MIDPLTRTKRRINAPNSYITEHTITMRDVKFLQLKKLPISLKIMQAIKLRPKMCVKLRQMVSHCDSSRQNATTKTKRTMHVYNAQQNIIKCHRINLTTRCNP